METVTVVMLVRSGEGVDSQWFDYRPSYFGDIVRVEWESGTDKAMLPRDIADYLFRHNYARPTVEGEVSTEDTVPPSSPALAAEPSSEVVKTTEDPPPPPPPSGKKKEKTK